MFIGTNFPLTAEYSESLRALVNRGNDPIRAWREAGLDYIELAMRRKALDRESFVADVDHLHQHGLNVNLHPYYEIAGFSTKTESPSLRPNILTMLHVAREIAQHEGRTVSINFHGATGRRGDQRADLIRQSFAFFKWMIDMVETYKAEVLITLEHQLPLPMGDDRMRIGDSFDEMLTLHEMVQHDRLKLCWDMGHSMMRHLYANAHPEPPARFPAGVGHVHIHDVDFAKRADHRLIGEGRSPLARFIQMLQKERYQGGWTMEYLDYEVFGADYTAFLIQSRTRLLELAGQIQPEK